MSNCSVFLFKRKYEIWVPLNLTQAWEDQDGLLQLAWIVQEEIQMSKKLVHKFLGWLIFAIVSVIIILTTASVCHCLN